MVSRRLLLVGGVVAVAAVGGAAYAMSGNDAGNAKKNYTVAIVTDVGGVDDKSFNQSAWEGLEKWGKSHKLTKGVNGYNYFQSKTQADYATNFQQAVTAKYSMVAGIGYSLHDATVNAAKKNPKTDFVLVDDIDTKKTKNVASVMFRSEQSSYLAGVAAATKAKDLGSNTVGFVGGMHGNIVDAFEAGYVAGVQSVDKNIKVDVQYADSFTDASKGQTITNAMIAKGEKVIFQAAGAVGNGVFTSAKDTNQQLVADSKDKVWVIGVDMDQSDMGAYTSKDGKKSNFTLTSSITGVGRGLELVANKAMKGEFPGGKTVAYGLKEGGVATPTKNMTDDEKSAVEKAKDDIVSGKIKVPNHPAGSKFNQQF
ncbi:BMP family lipoprotein [Weissella confusa]|uniref:BMP family lipoprotein n=1 Tax=Weissella confusa TaxID=1583 RepID=UPI0018F22E47|nr:BMP family protein [Weissella confusa]MBJ7672691.1 BMP family ABC transporter substrate-binding protein [Weissella confusa]